LRYLDDFVNLHHHTTNSYQDGFRPVEEHVQALVALGYPAATATEHGNVSSWVKLEKSCQAAGIKPIFGCELYCETGDERGQIKHHLTVVAQDATGYQNLNRLVSDAWVNFRYKPTVSSEMLAKYSDGLVAMSGCMGGLLADKMIGGKLNPERARADMAAGERVAGWFADTFPDRYYLEVMPHPKLKRQQLYNQALAELGDRMELPLVATLDCHYPHPEDKSMYPVLHAIGRGGKGNTVESQSQSWEYDIMLAPQEPAIVYRDLLRTGLSAQDSQDAMRNAGYIADQCNVTIPKFEDLRFPGKKPSDELLWDWVREGWEYRGFNNLPDKEYKRAVKQVKYEMGLIVPKGFADYFLVVSEVVKWAKDNGVAVGPARGSAAASLVCYLIRTTEVNPMNHPTLLFERFIDANRHDLPDIDLDFDDEERWRVRQHLVDMYGEAQVGNIATVTNYKGKNSLDDIARVYRVPEYAVKTIKEMIIERSSGDLRGDSTIEDSVAMFPKVKALMDQYPDLRQAQRLEGCLKGFSVHAAGLVVANGPLTEGVAVYTRMDEKTKTMRNVLSIDKYDAEHINALKIDALGLLTMNVIARCLRAVGMTLQDLYDLETDDPKVYEAFQRNEVVGIFQFDGRAMRSVNREVKPDNFEEICDINALARPGPLHSGAAAEYIQVKHKRKPAEHLHPTVDDITKWTNYQIVYQEQILQVVRRLGNFTWEQAAQIRKLISKKQGEQAFNRMRELFMDGCKQNGVKELNAGKIWKQLVTAGAYAFNSAHCVSYGLLAYWTMWLKVYYPLEFYCAGLQRYKDDKKSRKNFDMLREATARGIKILPPDPVRSQTSWSVHNGTLVAGLVQIPGIGEVMARNMIEWRKDFVRVTRVGAMVDKGEELAKLEWDDFTAVKGIGPATMEKVKNFCAEDDPFGIHLMARKLGVMRGWLNRNAEPEGMRRPTSRAEDVPYEPRKGEHVVLVAVRDRNLKDLYELHRSRTGEELDPSTVREPQFVNWSVILGEDETGPLTITVHRYGGLYERYKDMIWELDPKRHLLLVRGFKRREYRRAIYATELWALDPDKLKG
jgi:DNA polymerase-3 subunit alpha